MLYKHRYSATITERPFPHYTALYFDLEPRSGVDCTSTSYFISSVAGFPQEVSAHIRKQVMRFFEDSNPLQQAGNTETLLFVSPDRPTLYLLIWPAYAYASLVGLFNKAAPPPTEIMLHPLIYLCIYDLLHTLNTKIQRCSSYITENKTCFRWEATGLCRRSYCGNLTKYINTMCGSNAKSLALNLAAQTATING
jgi:hypothetical protein